MARFFPVLSIFLVLSACVMPVNLDVFLQDPKVVAIYEESETGAGLILVPPVIEDIKPELRWGVTPLAEGDSANISIASGIPITLTIVNESDYEIIEFYYMVNLGDPELYRRTKGFPGWPDFSIDTTIPPFNSAGTYVITITGTVGTIPDDVTYSTWFTLVVTS